MKSMIGNEEAKLVLALMHKKAEVPEDLKAKALEQLRVYSMACEAGSANSYLLDKLIEAIEANDIDKAKEIAVLASACLDYEDDSEEVPINSETIAAAKAVIDDFFADMRSKGLPDGAIEAILRKVIHEFIFVPLMYQDEMLAGYSGNRDCILVFGIGFTDDKKKLVDKFEAADQRIDMMRIAADEFDFEGKVAFLAIRYMLSGHEMELIIRGL